MVKRILVGLSGTPFTPVAVQRGIELAKRFEAELTGITVMDQDRIRNVGPFPAGAAKAAMDLADHRWEATGERVTLALREFRRKCRQENVSHKVVLEHSNPFDTLIAHARYHDLTIFGLRGLFDYGVVAEPEGALERIVTEGVRPIITVTEEFRTIRKALIAYSGSMQSAKTMRRFIQLNLWPEVELKIVHFNEGRSQPQTLLCEAQEYCYTHGFDAQTECLDGQARDGLLPCAQEWDADIVVLGNSARSLLLSTLFGSTMLSVIRNTDRPFFLSH